MKKILIFVSAMIIVFTINAQEKTLLKEYNGKMLYSLSEDDQVIGFEEVEETSNQRLILKYDKEMIFIGRIVLDYKTETIFSYTEDNLLEYYIKRVDMSDGNRLFRYYDKNGRFLFGEKAYDASDGFRVVESLDIDNNIVKRSREKDGFEEEILFENGKIVSSKFKVNDNFKKVYGNKLKENEKVEYYDNNRVKSFTVVNDSFQISKYYGFDGYLEAIVEITEAEGLYTAVLKNPLGNLKFRIDRKPDGSKVEKGYFPNGRVE